MLCDYDLKYLASIPEVKRVVELIEDLDTELVRAFDEEVLEVQNHLVDDLRKLIIDSKNGYNLSDGDIDEIIGHLVKPF